MDDSDARAAADYPNHAAIEITAALVLRDEVHQSLDAPGRCQGLVESVAGESVMAAISDLGLARSWCGFARCRRCRRLQRASRSTLTWVR